MPGGRRDQSHLDAQITLRSGLIHPDVAPHINGEQPGLTLVEAEAFAQPLLPARMLSTTSDRLVPVAMPARPDLASEAAPRQAAVRPPSEERSETVARGSQETIARGSQETIARELQETVARGLQQTVARGLQSPRGLKPARYDGYLHRSSVDRQPPTADSPAVTCRRIGSPTPRQRGIPANFFT